MKLKIKGPDHYQRGEIQPWDFIRDQGLNYHLGNVIKYVCRAGHKDDALDDLQKAIHYLENEFEHRSREGIQERIQHSELKDFDIPHDATEFDR